VAAAVQWQQGHPTRIRISQLLSDCPTQSTRQNASVSLQSIEKASMSIPMPPVSLITGASSGIGRALALELARRGHSLGLTARRMPLLESLRDEIHAACGKNLRIELAALDVCEFERVSPTMMALCARLGHVDNVIVNAGANDIVDIGRASLDKEIKLIQTNLTGAIATIDASVRFFRTQGKGHLVGISSLAGMQPIARQAAYCASKAGFSMYLKSARIELQPLGITVTDIRPGYIATDIVEGVDIAQLPFAITVAQAAREMAALIERRAKTGIVPAFPWRLIQPLIGHLPARFVKF
jgi:short-subunit dehydrogenase